MCQASTRVQQDASWGPGFSANGPSCTSPRPKGVRALMIFTWRKSPTSLVSLKSERYFIANGACSCMRSCVVLWLRKP